MRALTIVRLRLAQVSFERSVSARQIPPQNQSRDLLETSIENLTQLTQSPELADDRLAWSSLQVAYEALSRVLAAIGEDEQAEQIHKKGEAIRRTTPDGRSDHWWE